MRIAPLLILATGVLAGCMNANDHATQVGAGGGANDRLALGTVQREIRVGMTNADVVAVLGSPNMVTTDEQRRENWVYDRVASESVYSSGAAGANVLFLGAGTSSGASRRSQRTLTIVIRFDGSGRVRDFSYRSSSF